MELGMSIDISLTQGNRALVLPHHSSESSTRSDSWPSRCCSLRGRVFRPEIEAGDPGKQRCTDGTTAEEKPTHTGVAGRPPPTASPFDQLAST
jgi:hypothetical protein